MSQQMTTNLPLTTIKQGTELVNLVLATGLMQFISLYNDKWLKENAPNMEKTFKTKILKTISARCDNLLTLTLLSFYLDDSILKILV
jgi:hypothetical protein